ncbi:MAG TPA: dihydrofolate reductase [Pseudomonadales bacterium]|nr:dihydrofolate reductase [Pseudomonadales bacterium]
MAGKKTIALIVARTRNGVIGRNNTMPWHLPEDLRYFKRVTLGKPIIMGRNTWESLGKPLPGRDNIVITRNKNFCADGATVVNDLETALQLADSLADARGVEEVMIIGGAQIYKAALEHVQRAYITEIDADIDGDTFFPMLDAKTWKETSREHFPSCDKNPYPYSFLTLDRL